MTATPQNLWKQSHLILECMTTQQYKQRKFSLVLKQFLFSKVHGNPSVLSSGVISPTSPSQAELLEDAAQLQSQVWLNYKSPGLCSQTLVVLCPFLAMAIFQKGNQSPCQLLYFVKAQMSHIANVILDCNIFITESRKTKLSQIDILLPDG